MTALHPASAANPPPRCAGSGGTHATRGNPPARPPHKKKDFFFHVTKMASVISTNQRQCLRHVVHVSATIDACVCHWLAAAPAHGQTRLPPWRELPRGRVCPRCPRRAASRPSACARPLRGRHRRHHPPAAPSPRPRPPPPPTTQTTTRQGPGRTHAPIRGPTVLPRAKRVGQWRGACGGGFCPRTISAQPKHACAGRPNRSAESGSTTGPSVPVTTPCRSLHAPAHRW